MPNASCLLMLLSITCLLMPCHTYLLMLYTLHCKEAIPKIGNNYSQKRKLRGHSPNFHIHVSVSDFYNPTIDLPILLQEICGLILRIYIYRLQTHEFRIGTEFAQFLEKEYINGIFVAVCPIQGVFSGNCLPCRP
jgi:hypothetical protein